ncbi:MAG: alpha/beta hydrolase [Planctomycetes bacterium]|nr:alpha/beta hydrolase [Planctomycetota bacterium]
MKYRSVAVSGGSIRYLEAGSGPALFVLHGAGVQATAFAPALKRLAQDFRVVAPDLPGFGGSFTPPADWTADDYVPCVLELAATLGISGFDIAAHSFGGAVAIACAAASSAVRRLVLIDPLAVPPPWGKAGLLFRFFVLKTLEHVLRPSHWARMLGVFIPFLASALLRPGRMNRMTGIVLREVYREARPFAKVVQPVTILWGDHDQVFPAASARQLAALLPRARVTLVHGGHDWPLVSDEQAARLIGEAFVPTHPPGCPGPA